MCGDLWLRHSHKSKGHRGRCTVFFILALYLHDAHNIVQDFLLTVFMCYNKLKSKFITVRKSH